MQLHTIIKAMHKYERVVFIRGLSTVSVYSNLNPIQFPFFRATNLQDKVYDIPAISTNIPYKRTSPLRPR